MLCHADYCVRYCLDDSGQGNSRSDQSRRSESPRKRIFKENSSNTHDVTLEDQKTDNSSPSKHENAIKTKREEKAKAIRNSRKNIKYRKKGNSNSALPHAAVNNIYILIILQIRTIV